MQAAPRRPQFTRTLGTVVTGFVHARDVTPACTTELGDIASISPEFGERGVKAIGLHSGLVLSGSPPP